MRVLYIDIDTLRRDHLGCHRYHRNTSPNIDALGQQGAHFDNYCNSDAPCPPSRTALWAGRFGFYTGVVGHGGTTAEPYIEGPTHSFRDTFHDICWMTALRRLGFKTATVSPFGEHHAAWHWYAGFNEIYNPGKSGDEIAEEISRPSPSIGSRATARATTGSSTSTPGIRTRPIERGSRSATPLRTSHWPSG